MIPSRFVTEYSARCLDLLTILEPIALEKGLVGSFSLLAAASLLTVPYERMQAKHPMQDTALTGALRQLEKQRFVGSDIWQGNPPIDWRMARIVSGVNRTDAWKDERGLHPFDDGAANVLPTKRAKDVFQVMRNALAHGNIIYLDERGIEKSGAAMAYLGFLSRYEESELERSLSTTHRLLAAPEEEFLRFIKLWSGWLAGNGADSDMSFAA